MKKKFATWTECLCLREVKSLQMLIHPNIVRLLELVREADLLYFVFEYVPENLYQVLRSRKSVGLRFLDHEVRSVSLQLLLALEHMHKNGYFHRDIKPENILVQQGASAISVKLADFGQAREIRSQPPYSEYISTRWYRAPEVLLRKPYSAPIDIWAVACVIVELYAMAPLFPGATEIDQLYRISKVLGPPPTSYLLQNNIAFSAHKGTSVWAEDGLMLSEIPRDGRQFLADTLVYDPTARPTASQAVLYYSFFKWAPRTESEASIRPVVFEGCPSPSIDELLADFESLGKSDASPSASTTISTITRPQKTTPTELVVVAPSNTKIIVLQEPEKEELEKLSRFQLLRRAFARRLSGSKITAPTIATAEQSIAPRLRFGAFAGLRRFW